MDLTAQVSAVLPPNKAFYIPCQWETHIDEIVDKVNYPPPPPPPQKQKQQQQQQQQHILQVEEEELFEGEDDEEKEELILNLRR